jgi:hypothetical protein
LELVDPTKTAVTWATRAEGRAIKKMSKKEKLSVHANHCKSCVIHPHLASVGFQGTPKTIINLNYLLLDLSSVLVVLAFESE